jgi:hypothetical protein
MQRSWEDLREDEKGELQSRERTEQRDRKRRCAQQ